MIFKNNRGEVPSYVIGLIIAIIILLVAAGAVYKITQAQKQATNSCVLAGNQCIQGNTCTTGLTSTLIGTCPNNQVCCAKAQS